MLPPLPPSPLLPWHDLLVSCLHCQVTALPLPLPSPSHFLSLCLTASVPFLFSVSSNKHVGSASTFFYLPVCDLVKASPPPFTSSSSSRAVSGHATTLPVFVSAIGGGGTSSGASGGLAGSIGGLMVAPTDSESEESEMGRLETLLASRGLPPSLFGALGPRMQHILHRSVSSSISKS